MISSIGVGGIYVITNAASNLQLEAGANNADNINHIYNRLVRCIFRDNSADADRIVYRVWTNVSVAYVSGTTENPSNLAANVAGAVDITEALLYKVDGMALDYVNGKFTIMADGVRAVHINNDVRGAGLAITNGVLSVNPDGSTLELNGDQVWVKDLGITTAKLAALAVTAAKLGAIAGGGLTGGNGSVLSVDPDGSSLEINGSAEVAVKDLGISTAKIAADAVTTAKSANDRKYFFSHIDIDVADLGANYDMWVPYNFQLIEMKLTVVQDLLGGGELQILFNENGNSEGLWSVIATAQNDTESWNGFTSGAPLDINSVAAYGTDENHLVFQTSAYGILTSGKVRVTLICKYA